MNYKELTAAETVVMKCIWDADHEPGLSEIVNAANTVYGKEWKPQTVSTFVERLRAKDYLKMKRAGRVVTYEVLVTEDEYRTAQARKFVSFWNGGSIRQFLTAFYKDKPATEQELKELRGMIDELGK